MLKDTRPVTFQSSAVSIEDDVPPITKRVWDICCIAYFFYQFTFFWVFLGQGIPELDGFYTSTMHNVRENWIRATNGN